MSRKSAYEDALSGKMEEFPLPDEDASWQKMQRLLDDDDDRGFWFFRDYRVLGLLTVLLIGWGIWLMNAQLDEKKASGRSVVVDRDGTRSAQTAETSGTDGNAQATETAPVTKRPQLARTEKVIQTTAQAMEKSLEKASSFAPRPGYNNINNPAVTNLLYQKKNSAQSAARNINDPETVSVTLKINRKGKRSLLAGLSTINNLTSEKVSDLTNESHQVKTNAADTASNLSAQTITQDNSNTVPDSKIVKQKNSTDSTSDKMQVVKLAKPSSRKYQISAGLGLQQQIQVGGQQSIKYGYRATSLVSDYIPSAWINFGQKDNWFLQTGFVYSSPQLVKEFAFNRQTKADTFGTVTNTLILKKTFYSQLPISFNYYVKPNWSIGAGMTFTWLRGAIAEKETRIKNISSQAPVVSRQIIPINNFTDSFLYRSHSFFTLQSDYQWKRISFGLKYTKDLQSYIKYTMPDGTVAEDRNWGLQAVLRVKLWQKSGF